MFVSLLLFFNVRTSPSICSDICPAHARLPLELHQSAQWQLWRLSVFADSPEVTSVGLSRIGNISRLHGLRLSVLRTGLINDALLYNLHKHHKLRELKLGHPDSPPVTSFTAPAVVRSVRGGLAIHTHTDSYIRPDV